MAALIPQSFIDDLLSRIDLVDVISQRIKLKKAGKNYSACCPFHNEKTPSFSVSPDKQFYHCFGCGASGNAVKFVMEYDGKSFPDCIEELASSVGLSVPKEQSSHHEVQQEQQQQPLLTLMQQASQHFEQMLATHPQRIVAEQYLASRGLSPEAVQFFGIGYAPTGWDNLALALNPSADKNITKQLVACGMLIEKEDGRSYDRFRDRIMFPIRDIRGRVIAFGGRVLTNEKPKYLNSPETPIFHKGQELYGLYEARKVRQKLTRMVVVEGYMDVIALAQYGVHYAVATLGTATSEHHLRRLFKIVPEVIFCFDGDNAGRTAASRAMEIVLPLLSDGLQVKFLFLPESDDPDSLIRKEGKEGFEQRLNQAEDLPEFLFKHLKQQIDFDSMQGKARFDQLAAPLISRLPHGTLRNLMEQQLESELGTVSAALQHIKPATTAAPITLMTERADAPVPRPVVALLEPQESTLAPMVYKALRSICQAPQLAKDLETDGLEAQTEQERLLLEIIKKLKHRPQNSSVSLMIQWTGTPYSEQISSLINNELSIPPSLGDISEVLRQLNARKLKAQLDVLDQRYLQGDRLNAEERQQQRELRKQLHELQKNRSKFIHNPRGDR